MTPASTANDGTIAGAARQNRLLAAWWLASESARGFRGESSRTPCAIAFADQVARLTGDVRVAQYLLGHATLGTTETCLGAPTLDQLSGAVANVRFGITIEQTFQGAGIEPPNPVEAPTGFEPVYTALQAAA